MNENTAEHSQLKYGVPKGRQKSYPQDVHPYWQPQFHIKTLLFEWQLLQEWLSYLNHSVP